jgi:hypothetical protein
MNMTTKAMGLIKPIQSSLVAFGEFATACLALGKMMISIANINNA